MSSTRVHALATRQGFWVAVLALGMFTSAAAWEFRRYASSILEVQAVIEQHQSVRSHSALNEMTRLGRVLIDASFVTDAEETDLEEVRSALDVLYVRAEHMGRRMDRLLEATIDVGVVGIDSMGRDGKKAVLAVNAFVTLADKALAEDDPVSALLTPEISSAMEQARVSVFRYLDQTTRIQSTLLAEQTQKVEYLNRATLIFMLTVTLAGIISLHLLRREIVARHDRRRAERRADRLAYFDALTGLANRVQFQDRVDAFLSPTAKGGFILIDLDSFKEINDRHGHAVGDAVLKHVARAIGDGAEAHGGAAARLGGDEFAVFMETDNTQFLMDFCQDLIDKCALPVEVSGSRLFPGVSIGIATTTQVTIAKRTQYDFMMRVADFALYASKEAGRGRYTLYDADLELTLAERRGLMKDLPKAIENHELEVFLQPKIHLESGSVSGFEALVRWRRDGTLLEPGRFIKIAEDSDRIRDVDAYVLDRAVGLISDWNRRYRTDYSVSVNLSAEHFRNREPLPFVEEALKKHGLAAEKLTLEITETVQLSSWDIVEATVNELKSLGCRISIDDFGTGYSSLVYLRTISADELKIDKSLIDEIEHSSEAQFILDAVIDLAHSLGLEVVIEGIERDEQLDIVRKLGCKSGQGYLFGRPSPASDALADATYAHPELRRVSL